MTRMSGSVRGPCKCAWAYSILGGEWSFGADLDERKDVWGQKQPLIVKSWRQNWDELSAV